MPPSPSYSAVPSLQENHAQQPTRTFSSRQRPWQTGVVRRLPWSGLISILFALGFAIAAVCVGLQSDGKQLDYLAVNGYVVQPAVLLSVFATLANALLVYAFTQGATIHWWNTAFKGATLGQLHSSFHYGSGVTAVFSSVAAFNTVALASIMMPILLADGPLLQRSVSVEQRLQMSHLNKTIPFSPAPLIQGSTAIITDHASDTQPSLYHPLFAKVLQQYTNREPILFPNETCIGECQIEIVAPGWDVDCSETTEPYILATMQDGEDYSDQTSLFPNGTVQNSTYNGPTFDQTVFRTEVVYNYTLSNIERLGNHGAMQFGVNLKTMYKSTPGLKGTMNHHNCWLREAIVRYPLRLANNTVSLGAMPAARNRTVERVLRLAEFQGQGDYPSTLGGFWLSIHSAFNSQAKLRPVGSWYSLTTSSSASSQYLRAPNASALATYNVTWEDPMPDMILMANELAFRTAYMTSHLAPSAPGLPAIQSANRGSYWNLTSDQPYILSPNLTSVNRALDQKAMVSASTPMAVYATHRGYLAGGFVLMCLACLAIAPTYWGWWRLGREVSMSPLEIARAFNAPVLQNADPNATGGDLKKDFGAEKIKFVPGHMGGLHEEHIALTEYAAKSAGGSNVG